MATQDTTIQGEIKGHYQDDRVIALEGVPVLLFERTVRGLEYRTMARSDSGGMYRFQELDSKTSYSIRPTNPVDIDGDGFPEWVMVSELGDRLTMTPSDTPPQIFYRQIVDPNVVASVKEDLGAVSGAVQDIAAYPILTEGAGLQGGPPAPNAPGGGASLGQVVESTLRNVLGWRPRAKDPKGFAAALAQSFSPKEKEGHTEWEWTPRSYAVQADMGAITGAQASIYARAQNALDQAMPLLEGLYPLKPAADPENVEAQRAIVRSDLTELVNELGVQGGPRVQRVDSLFMALLKLGPSDPLDNPEKVKGHLGDLKSTFGLTRKRVNTVDEEQDLTNFLILVDHVNALKQSWDAQRGFYDGTASEPYLGTQLVLLSRTLAVVAESKQELDFALDSVNVRSAERQTIRLNLDRDGTMFVGELLEWVDRLASIEGPRLINEGGKAGVRAVARTLGKLCRLVRRALIPPQDATTLPAGYRTARVQRALLELADRLDEAANLASRF